MVMILLLMNLSMRRHLLQYKPPQDEFRRSTRERRPSSIYNPHEYVLLIDARELESYSEALNMREKITGCKLCKRR